MKAFLNYFLLIAIFSFFASSCEKDNLSPDENNLNPDSNALRISKIADNIGMERPDYLFTYDEKGLLVEIKARWQETPIYITYNENDLPVQMTTDSDPMCCGEMDTKIEFVWGKNSFTKSKYFENELQYTSVYELDSEGRIINIMEDGADYYNIVWEGGNRVDVSLERDEAWGETMQYNEYHNPMSAINLAILNTFELTYIGTEFDNVYQNKYCISTYEEWPYGAEEIEYKYNKDGYPIRGANVTANDYVYFEYETD